MSDLKLKFVQKLLRFYEKNDSITLNDIYKERACEKGENFMSIVTRLTIKGSITENNNLVDYKKALIIKTPYTSDLMQSTFNSSEIFMNEVIAYNELIPLLQKYLKISLAVPNCLLADKDMIILEDVTEEGFDMRKDVISMSVDQCVAVLKELAVLHSASIILKQYEPENVEKLSKKIMETFLSSNITIADLIKHNLSGALTLLKSVDQTNEIKNAIKVLNQYKSRIYHRVCDLFKEKKSTSVFNHGDCWRNNILFKNVEGELEVKFIDLQGMRYSSVAADLNYFLYINLLPEDISKNWDLLLDSYLTSLHGSFALHNIEMDYEQYSKQWLEEEMSNFSVFGFMCSLWIAPAFYLDKNTFPDMEAVKPEEMEANYHEEFILKHMTPNLKDRMISLVLNFVNKPNF